MKKSTRVHSLFEMIESMNVTTDNPQAAFDFYNINTDNDKNKIDKKTKLDDILSCSTTAMTITNELAKDKGLSKRAAEKSDDGMLLTKSNRDNVIKELMDKDDFVSYVISEGSMDHDWVLAKENGSYYLLQSNANTNAHYVFPKLNNGTSYNSHLENDQEFKEFIYDITDGNEVGNWMQGFKTKPQVFSAFSKINMKPRNPIWRIYISDIG